MEKTPLQPEEYYFSFSLPASEVLRALSHKISIDKIIDGQVFAYANASEYEYFRSFSIDHQQLPHPGDIDFDPNMKDWQALAQKDLTDSWDFYPTYDAYVGLMEQFETDFPELCKIYSIGQTVQGRELLFAKISAKVNQKEAEPQFMYSSTMHGDETTGFILSLRLIHYLLNNYQQDEAIKDLLDNNEIWICPNENPDGTYRYDNNTIDGARRYNANGVDLNRNYPNPVESPPNAQQPETAAMIAFVDTMNFVMSANMHGGAELVNYPFDSWTSEDPEYLHADHEWWQLVSHEYADTARFYSPYSYMNPSGASFDRGITHGGDWYVVYGSRQDYLNYYAATRELTLELSWDKILPPEQLPAHWEYNHRSLLNYIRQASYGIRGLVTDRATGLPVVATIEIAGHDKNNSEVFSEPYHGSFFRLLLAGTYDVIVSAPGYLPVEYFDVAVENYNYVFLDVQLGDPALPVAVFQPQVLEFPPVAAPGVSQAILHVSNEGDTALEVSLDEFRGDQVFEMAGDPAKEIITIDPGASGEIAFRFVPQEPGVYSGDVLISTNDPLKPLVVITLNGEAVESAAEIFLVDHALDFGQVPVGGSQLRTLEILNAGNVDLVIDSIGISDSTFTVEAVLPLVLASNERIDLEVTFVPAEVRDYEAFMRFGSNAVNVEFVEISLLGSGESGVFTAKLPSNETALVYPNPVDASSVLRLNVQQPGAVEVAVLDASGGITGILFSGHKETGIHYLNAGNAFSDLRPGIYFIKIDQPQQNLLIRVVKIL
ncbi:MAG: M14 family zinc carboxypeptidase [Bacteroidales bacterium]